MGEPVDKEEWGMTPQVQLLLKVAYGRHGMLTIILLATRYPVFTKVLTFRLSFLLEFYNPQHSSPMAMIRTI